MRPFIRISMLLTVIVLLGCKSNELEFVEVQKEWATMFRQLGIVPIYPPREDYFVGDVYASSYDPHDPESISIFLSNEEVLNCSEF